MRITVSDVLEYLASGMTEDEIISDFPELIKDDIHACLSFAADREKKFRRHWHEAGFRRKQPSILRQFQHKRFFVQTKKASRPFFLIRLRSGCLEEMSLVYLAH